MVGWFYLCSTEPEIDYNKLDDNYFIYCALPFTDTTATGEVSDNTITVTINRLRYLIEYAFADEEDRLFSVRSARVTITGNGMEYNLVSNNRGEFKYTFQNAEETIKPDKDYTLNVVLPNGTVATSQIHTPLIAVEPKDTIWIYPDSVLTWSIPEYSWYPKTPLSVNDEISYKDTIKYYIPQDKDLIGVSHEPSYYEPASNFNVQTDHLWIRFDTIGTALIISTASDSPSVFINKFEQDSLKLYFSCIHRYSSYVSEIFSNTEEYGIIDNLEDYSNISDEGGYGIFTSQSYRIEKKFTIKVKNLAVK